MLTPIFYLMCILTFIVIVVLYNQNLLAGWQATWVVAMIIMLMFGSLKEDE